MYLVCPCCVLGLYTDSGRLDPAAQLWTSESPTESCSPHTTTCTRASEGSYTHTHAHVHAHAYTHTQEQMGT